MKLPNIIPVFPLSNFIIFPRTSVPLNIFEPRYLEMVNDSMKNNKLIGLMYEELIKIQHDLGDTLNLRRIFNKKIYK